MLCETNLAALPAGSGKSTCRSSGGVAPTGASSHMKGTTTKAAARHGMMELSVEEPRKAGLKTYYLPRGVDDVDGWR